MRETYGPVILKRKAERLRKETGNLRLYTKFEIHGVGPLGALWIALQRPSKMLILSPITFLLSVYFAFVFGLLILLFTTLSSVYSRQYGFSVSMAGLSFLGSGLGSGVGLVVFGALSDKVAKKVSAKGSEWKPEARLLLMVWFAPVMPGGFFWYGWTAHYQVHWILPIIGTSFISMGALMVMVSRPCIHQSLRDVDDDRCLFKPILSTRSARARQHPLWLSTRFCGLLPAAFCRWLAPLCTIPSDSAGETRFLDLSPSLLRRCQSCSTDTGES